MSSLLTPRDQKALLLLVNARLTADMSPSQRAPWWALRQRLQGDLSAQPKSMASLLATLVNSARAGELDEVDRMAKSLSSALIDHGDLEGSRLLTKIADAKYERPKPPPRLPPARQGGGGGAPPPGPDRGDGAWTVTPARTKGPDDAGGAIRWHMPRDMRDEYVMDAHVGPMIERLVAELRLSQVFLDAGIDAPTRVLFTGPPGTGKTMTALYIAGCLGLPVAVAKISKIVGKYLGDTGAKLSAVIKAAVDGRGLLFMDEIDGLCQARSDEGGDGASKEMQRVTTGLLQDLDGLPLSQIVIAATNVPNAIDSALRSRLVHEIAFKNPDPDARRLMVTKHWSKVVHASEAMTAFVTGTDGKSGRFIRAAAMGAARAALLEASTLGTALASLEGKVDLASVSQAKITPEHVRVALAHAKREA
jgi:ATPase family associated with various cellular activities (AAA)